MPYRRSSRGRRRPRRRRAARSSGTSYASTAARALSLAMRVASMVNAEKNFYDASTSLPPTTTPTIQPLQLIPEGDDTQMRNGRSIKLAGITFKSHWYTGSTTSPNIIRLIFFRDNFQHGLAPVASDILVAPITVDSFRNINTANPGRYTILMDREVKLNPVGSSSPSAVVNHYFDIKSHVRYTGTTGTAAVLGQGQIYVMYFCDNLSGGGPSCALNFRTRYYDN